jgi:trehalose 6-phosphate synthase
MARIFIISNRVSVPSHPRLTSAGGLEVVLRATLRNNKCVWVGWSGVAVDETSDVQVHHQSVDGNDYVVTDLARQDFEEYYNGFANRVLWPVLITGRTWRNSPAATCRDICVSTIASPTS